MSTLFKYGVSYINQAVDYEKDNKQEEALEYYKKGTKTLIDSLQFEKNPYMIKNIKMRCMEYLERATAIKNSIAKKKEDTAEKELEDENVSDLRRQLLSVIVMESPNVQWEDVAGLDSAKDELYTSTILPMKHPEFFVGKRRPWSGILLFGPPGTGKSFLAKAVATVCKSTFFSVSSADLVSKWQGESARLVKELFTLAREKKPSIVFIDEIDSLCSTRDSSNQSSGERQVLTELLVQMDGVGKDQTGVLVLGATNIPWSIDPAMRRRFQKRIYIPLPDYSARLVMFRNNFGTSGHDLTEKDFEWLASQTEGYSGSDISNVVHQALYLPLHLLQRAKFFRKNEKGKWEACEGGEGAVETSVYKLPKGEVEVPLFHASQLEIVMKKATRSTNLKELQRFMDWMKEFGESGVCCFCFQTFCKMPPKKSGPRKKYEKMKAAQIEKHNLSRLLGSSQLLAYGDMSKVPGNFEMECSECGMKQKNHAFCYFCHSIQKFPVCAHCGRMKCSGVGTDCLVKHPGTTVTGMKFVGSICDFCEAFVCHSKKCTEEHACACPFRESASRDALTIKCCECQRDVWHHGGKMYQCNICGKWCCQDDQFEHQAMCQTLEGESFKCVSCNKRGQWSCMRCKISYCDLHVLSALNKDRTGVYKCKKCQYELKDVSNLSLSVKKHDFGRQGVYQSDDEEFPPY